MELAKARPPYVEFKRVAKHLPKASIEAGKMMYKDIDMAYVMQPGGKDMHEAIAAEWLASIKNKSLSGAADALPPEWIDALHKKYESWKAGQEAPVQGTSIKLWPVLSPAQVEMFLALHVHTVEDVAGLTEEAMGRFGMGARDLRDKAREWLSGKEIADQAMAENAALKAQLAALNERMAAMEAGPKAAVIGQIDDELAGLQAQYITKFGKKPHHKKSADSLRKELA